MSFAIGEMVGPYRIVEQLGQGGMATVFKAYHAALDRYVALKVLHPAFNQDPNFLARFQREARLVARLDHPNIVPIFDYAEQDGRPYLVMKFIEGETLKARLTKERIDPVEIVRIVEAVGAGLQFAHKRGILHRDIKPSNVLLSIEGGIYLADFGLARIAQAGESTLTSDMILGTPQYISPEQALGKKDLDEGTDIYSFGVMLYELSVGKVPFSADTPFSIIHDHIYSPLPMPRVVNPSVAEAVERVLLKSLAKDRNDRYKDVQAMVDAFTHAWIGSKSPVPIGADTERSRRHEPTPEIAPVPATVVAAKITDKSDSTELTIDSPLPDEIKKVTERNAAERPRRALPWMWIAVGILLIICCVIGGIALRNYPFEKLRDLESVPNTETAVPLITKVFGEIELAKQAVDANPEDPAARLQLAMAYLHDGQNDQANLELDKAMSNADQDIQFFINAGAMLSADGYWLQASVVYLRAGEIEGSGNLSRDLQEKLYEAIYKAFILPDARGTISYERIGAVDRPLMYIARARYSFYNVDQTQGWSALADLDTSKPNLPESGLLHGEFYARSNQPRDARAALNTLLATIDLAKWIQVEAQNLLESLPK